MRIVQRLVRFANALRRIFRQLEILSSEAACRPGDYPRRRPTYRLLVLRYAARKELTGADAAPYHRCSQAPRASLLYALLLGSLSADTPGYLIYGGD